ADGQTYSAKLNTVFAPMNMSLAFAANDFTLAPGVSGNTELSINYAAAVAQFTIQYSGPFHLLGAAPTTTVQIGASASLSIPIPVTYPANISGIVAPAMAATASVNGDAARTGTATLTLWQGV